MNHTGQTRLSKAQILIQQKYDQFVDEYFAKTACPHCMNSSELTHHGKYRRWLYVSQSIRVSITVTRLRCHSCDKTFVLLPSEIVPYKRYVLAAILKAINLVNSRSVYCAENSLDIAARVIRRWRDQFNRWHRMLCITHDIPLNSSDEANLQYSRLRPGRRLMQIISAWTQKFHVL
jgi:transposase-like protein